MTIVFDNTKLKIIGEPDIIFELNNLVDTITAVTDKETGWEYNLDIFMPENGQFNSILMTRNGQNLTVDLTRQMLPTNGRYICQFRGKNEEAVYRTEKFEIWVKDSIDMNDGYNPMPAEFYQMEAQMKDIYSDTKELYDKIQSGAVLEIEIINGGNAFENNN